MTRIQGIARVAGIALLATSSAFAAQGAKPTNDQFIKEAIQGNLAEVQVGQLAQQKGTSQDVKNFGAKLVQDHQAANQKAMEVAQQMNVTPPQQPSSKEKATYEKLSKLSGEQFDRDFIQAMLKDHRHDVAQYKQEAQANGPAASYAKEILPTLEEHLKMAEDAKRNEHIANASGSMKKMQ